MHPSRRMGRRIGAALVVLLTGVWGVGKVVPDSVDSEVVVAEGEEKGETGAGGRKGLGGVVKEAGDVVLPWAILAWTIVFGLATLRVAREQKRSAEREERERGWERRYEVARAMVGFIEKVDRELGVADVTRLSVEVLGKMCLFEQRERKFGKEFYGKALDLREVYKKLRGGVKGSESDELKREREELVEWFGGSAEGVKRVMEACWDRGR